MMIELFKNLMLKLKKLFKFSRNKKGIKLKNDGFNEEELLSEEEVTKVRKEFCEGVRNALNIDFVESTIFKSMESDATFIESKWDNLGKIVLPYVYGGIEVEGPQSIIKNSFIIGYFLGSLKEKHKDEYKKWENFTKLL